MLPFLKRILAGVSLPCVGAPFLQKTLQNYKFPAGYANSLLIKLIFSQKKRVSAGLIVSDNVTILTFALRSLGLNGGMGYSGSPRRLTKPGYYRIENIARFYYGMDCHGVLGRRRCPYIKVVYAAPSLGSLMIGSQLLNVDRNRNGIDREAETFS